MGIAATSFRQSAPRRGLLCRVALGTAAAALLGTGVQASPSAALSLEDLTRLSVEELSRLRVVTVTRRPQAQVEAPGALHVVTAEDIHRTGATSLPEALRLSPGLQASQIDANEWALSIRGFASRLSRSIQVVQDGRTLWTPLFAGVFWDAQDAFLDDIERIEVSRGPGGATFGANALNGVILINSKPAADTRGGLLTVGGGNAERLAGLRWGGALGTDTHIRAQARYSYRDGTRPRNAALGYDDAARMTSGGFRLDGAAAGGLYQIHGDVYQGRFGERTVVATFEPPYSKILEGDGLVSGGNLVAAWQRSTAQGETRVQAYYDRTHRDEVHFDERRNTFDLDLQQRRRWSSGHETVAGAGYRASVGDFAGEPTLQVLPGRRTDDIANLFVNHEGRFLGDRLRLTLGSRLEWNDYSGWNLQPSGRLAFTTGHRTAWCAVTRAVRTSSRIERDVLLYTSLDPSRPLFARTVGNDAFRPESVLAYEAGYKARLADRVFATAAAFYNVFDDLASNEPGPPEPETGVSPARLVVPVHIRNGQSARAGGVESGVTVVFDERFRFRASYAYTSLRQRTEPGSLDQNRGFEGNTPHHQAWLSAYLTPVPRLDVDVALRGIGAVPTHDVPAHAELDGRLAYRVTDRMEIDVVGKNLLHPRHVEFGGGFEIERAAFARATVRW